MYRSSSSPTCSMLVDCAPCARISASSAAFAAESCGRNFVSRESTALCQREDWERWRRGEGGETIAPRRRGDGRFLSWRWRGHGFSVGFLGEGG